MADDKMADDHDMPGAGRPKRPPPTLELAATSVSERPAPHAAADEPAEEPAPADTSPSDMPPFTPTDAEAEQPAAPPRQRAPLLLLPLAAGAVAGAVVAGIAWFALDHLSAADTSDTDALATRVSQLEARPVPKPDTTVAARIDGLERTLAALRSDLAATKTQPAATVDLAPVTARLTAIERATADLKSSAAQQSAKPVDDSALRRLVAASLLDSLVRQNEPYATALAVIKPLAGNDAALQPLEPFAASGLPSDAALCRDLLALLPTLALAQTETTPANAGFVDRLQASAARLVRIERTDAPGSGDRAAVARASAAARSNDIATARRELMTLPAEARAPVQPWLDRLSARDAALAASRQFAADTMAALSKPAP